METQNELLASLDQLSKSHLVHLAAYRGKVELIVWERSHGLHDASGVIARIQLNDSTITQGIRDALAIINHHP